MRFYSTNRKAPEVDFKTALLQGLASDGGLYMPRQLPQVYKVNKVFKVHKALKEFIDIPEKDLKEIIKDVFNFPVPLVKLDENLYILELFHGPTFSFKDFGARFMARAMGYYVKRIEEREKRKVEIKILVATSGDTGSAVAAGFYNVPNIEVYILYPSGKVSGLQEKQLTTFGGNIIAIEVKGNFDDCQRLAKIALADGKLREKISLSSANSINIGRLLPQMVYYFAGYRQYLGLRPTIDGAKTLDWPIFVVPSGNFGNLTAGLFAKKMGLPVKKFIAAVNINSGVPEYLRSGKLKVKSVKLTLSNAMDVGNPSNWARIIDLYRDQSRTYADNNADLRGKIKKDIEAITVTNVETRTTIREVYKKYGYIADPHTAVGLAAAKKSGSLSSSSVIVLATAHPAKFKEIVEEAIGKKIKLPKQLAKVQKKKKQSIIIKPTKEAFYKILLNVKNISSS